MQIRNWQGQQIDVARSSGGVLAVADPWDNVVRTGVRPWPAPELIQKLYQSRQARAFVDAEHATATDKLGFYSGLQSLHSEDAITWSVFGPIVYAAPATRLAFVRDLLALIAVEGSANSAHVWLWRRLPHPDTLVPGGPEIDFGIHTDDVFLLGEAKWRSSVGAAQGVNRDKDQLTLRRGFCQKYGQPFSRAFADSWYSASAGRAGWCPALTRRPTASVFMSATRLGMPSRIYDRIPARTNCLNMFAGRASIRSRSRADPDAGQDASKWQ